MGVVAINGQDPLLGGFYTVAEAARLLRMDNRQRIYRWLRRPDGNRPPVILRDYDPINGTQELSFLDLFEIRFVEHFRAQKLSLQYLRKVAARARQELNCRHPFALSSAEYVTDRKRVFEQVAFNEATSVREILSGQYEMYEVIEGVIAKGVSFDPKTMLAAEWRPMMNDCPNVVINPRYAFGQPVIGERRVPTSAVYRQWHAEKGDSSRVAAWWDIDRDHVDEAIEFEIRLAA